METRTRNILVLGACQALSLGASSTVFSIAPLVGLELAGSKSLSTVPVTCSVLGTALVTIPLSMAMRRFGRAAGFAAASACGAVGMGLAALALATRSFTLLCLGMLLFGVHSASAQYYRFAAADTSPVETRGSAISLVLGGGVLGAVIGPELGKRAMTLVAAPYLGVYLMVTASLLGILMLTMALRIPPLTSEEQHGAARPLAVVARQPEFVVAVLAASLGFGVMNLLMVATPIAMQSCGHGYDAAISVIEWHVVAMYAPSFFTGAWIRRLGVLTVMMTGLLLQAACVAVALHGTDIHHFWVALVLLGVGWNFLYVGATTLLTEAYRPAERAKSQGLSELLVAVTLTLSSSTSGWLLARHGWTGPRALAVPLLAVTFAAIAWLIARRRGASPAAA
jgi:MFS family permease